MSIPRFRTAGALSSTVVLTLLAGCSEQREPTPLEASVNLRERLEEQGVEVAATPVEALEAILDGELGTPMRALNRSVENLALPDKGARNVFADQVDVVDIAGHGSHGADDTRELDVDISHWDVTEHEERANDESFQLWSKFIDDAEHFKYAKFKVVRGEFVDGDESKVHTLTKFQGLARIADGFRYASGKLYIDWVKSPAPAGGDEVGEASWRIHGWHTKHLETQDVPELLFSDVLAQSVDASLYDELAARSAELSRRIAAIVVNSEAGRSYGEIVSQLDDGLMPFTRAEVDAALADGTEAEARFVELFYAQLTRDRAYLAGELGMSTAELAALENDVKARLRAARDEQRPWVGERLAKTSALRKEINALHQEIRGDARNGADAITVTDLDKDGFDDVFVSHNQKNWLLRNRGDGTFEDYTQVVDLPQSAAGVNHALFVDTDNDGDLDLFLGLWDDLRYYISEQGKFVDRTAELLDCYTPRGNVALAAADYDGDGLVDLYVQTRDMFRPLKELTARANLGMDDGTLFGALLPEKQARRFYEAAMADTTDSAFDRPAPPNMLLHNLGDGKFERAANTAHVELYRGTHFASWSDYDNDGDPDLYVANDFGPNAFFRNDDGVLVDITAETNTEDVGFGMGVSWGDFDNDLDHDLYVTNMYSKAGLRITDQAGMQGTRAQLAAHGNTLFENNGGDFEKVSGVEPPALTVEPGGWGWGAQFLDIDNDGFLDIYAPSGYISTPKGFGAMADT